MFSFIEALHLLFPMFSLLTLILGFYFKRKNWLIASLWLSLIGLTFHYQASGGEILGNYFNYRHACLYSMNLTILITSLLFILGGAKKTFKSQLLKWSTNLFAFGLITAALLLMSNLWINANFVEKKIAGTPILQVAAFSKKNYCEYKYIFYKVGLDKKIRYLCPNHYGLLPSVGHLKTPPTFVVGQLPRELKKNLKQV